MPVISATSFATSSDVSFWRLPSPLSSHSFCAFSRRARRSLSRSRMLAAHSKFWVLIAVSFSVLRAVSLFSSSRRLFGTVMLFIFTREQASSIRSIALSGRRRSAIYRADSATADSTASSRMRMRWCSSYRSRRPLMIATASSSLGSSTRIDWNRRSRALSFSMNLRYSSIVVAPTSWNSPRASWGFRMLAASTAPSAAPVPMIVCSSSIKRMMLPAATTSSIVFLIRSSKSPRYLVPATMLVRSSAINRFCLSWGGTSISTIRLAIPSAIAVLPTPASPIRQGLFLVRRVRIWSTRSISFSRPITGSIFPCRASSVRSRPYLSTSGVRTAGLGRGGAARRTPSRSAPVV